MSLPCSEVLVLGALQGVSELCPVSSLGHRVIVPALVGGPWARWALTAIAMTEGAGAAQII